MKKILSIGLLATIITGCASTPHKTSVKIYIQQRNWAKALKEGQAWVKEDPNNPEAYYWLSMAYTGMQKYQDAADNLIKAIDLDKQGVLKDKIGKNEINILLTAGKNTYNQNKDKSLKYFEYALKLAPKNKAALLSVATIYIQEGKLDTAEVYVNKAREIDPKNPLVYIYLANIYDSLAVHNPDKKDEYLSKAEENLKKTIELAPTKDNYAKLAAFYFNNSKENEKYLELAEEYYKKALEKDSTDVNILFNYGITAFNNKHYKDAINAFSKYLEKEPDDEGALQNLGLSSYLYAQKLENDRKKQVAKDYYRKAAGIYEKLVKLHPENADYYEMLYIFYAKLGNKNKAKEAMEKYKELQNKKQGG